SSFEVDPDRLHPPVRQREPHVEPLLLRDGRFCSASIPVGAGVETQAHAFDDLFPFLLRCWPHIDPNVVAGNGLTSKQLEDALSPKVRITRSPVDPELEPKRIPAAEHALDGRAFDVGDLLI